MMFRALHLQKREQRTKLMGVLFPSPPGSQAADWESWPFKHHRIASVLPRTCNYTEELFSRHSPCLTALVLILALPLSSWVTLGKLLNDSLPLCLCLQAWTVMQSLILM